MVFASKARICQSRTEFVTIASISINVNINFIT